jgi:hypothetical protein
MARDPLPEEEPRYADDERDYLPPGYFAPLRGIGTATWVLLLTNAALLGLRILLDFLLIGLMDDLIAGKDVPQRDLEAHDAMSLALTVFNVLAFVATGICFLTWIYRAYKNLPALGAGEPKHSPGWAVGSFFVPILNLYRPYQIVRETWVASDPASFEDDEIARVVRPSSPAVVGGWWATWIISGFLAQIAFRLSLDAKTPVALRGAAQLGIADAVLSILCAVLAVLVVRTITDWQEARNRRLERAEGDWEDRENARRELPPRDEAERERIRAKRDRRQLDFDSHIEPEDRG